MFRSTSILNRSHGATLRFPTDSRSGEKSVPLASEGRSLRHSLWSENHWIPSSKRVLIFRRASAFHLGERIRRFRLAIMGFDRIREYFPRMHPKQKTYTGGQQRGTQTVTKRLVSHPFIEFGRVIVVLIGHMRRNGATTIDNMPRLVAVQPTLDFRLRRSLIGSCGPPSA